MRAELKTADGATKWIEVAPIPAESISTAIKDTKGKIVGLRHYGLINKETIACYQEMASDEWIDEKVSVVKSDTI